MGCNIQSGLLIFRGGGNKKIDCFIKASEETSVAWSFSCEHQSVTFCQLWQGNPVFPYISLFIYYTSSMPHVQFLMFLINDHTHFSFVHLQYDKMPTWWLGSTFVTCINRADVYCQGKKCRCDVSWGRLPHSVISQLKSG